MRSLIALLVALAAVSGAAAINCVSIGKDVIRSGICDNFVDWFSENKDKIGENPTDEEIKRYLELAPIPVAECCTKVRPFIAAACACDEDVLYMVGRSGVTKKTMALLSRAVPMTVCNTAKYGAPIADGCKKSASAAAAAKTKA